MLTTLPAVTGLYTALVPVLLYMVMGTSRHLSVGESRDVTAAMLILWYYSQIEPRHEYRIKKVRNGRFEAQLSKRYVSCGLGGQNIFE